MQFCKTKLSSIMAVFSHYVNLILTEAPFSAFINNTIFFVLGPKCTLLALALPPTGLLDIS
jgi:hypothetical protein